MSHITHTSAHVSGNLHEISGDVIPRQEIPDCIWKLVHAHVPLSLPCITSSSICFILNNPTSIKTTRSTDGVSQSKELMLDMSTFGAPEDISQSDWQDAWINRLEIYKRTSEKVSTSTLKPTRSISRSKRTSLKTLRHINVSIYISVAITTTPVSR